MVRLFLIVIVIVSIFSCSPKFHGDARLIGEWQPLTFGLPNIYFDSSHYFIIVKDSSVKTAYSLNYKVESGRIIAYAKDATFSINNILRLTSDTLILQDDRANDVIYYIRKRE